MSQKPLNKRKISSWSRYQLWIDTKNKCPLCESELILPIGEIKDFNKEQKRIFKSWSKNHQDQKHVGVISHIVSYSNLEYIKAYKNVVSEVMIRSRFTKHKSFDKFIKEKTKFKKLQDENNPKSYKDSIIEHYWNKIILCYYCSQKIDGKLFKNLENFSNFENKFHQKTPDEQIQFLINLKNNNFKKDFNKNNFNYDFFSIKISTQEEFIFIKNTINAVFPNIEIEKIKFYVDKNVFSNQLENDVWEIFDFLNNEKINNMGNFIENKNLKEKIKKILPESFKSLNKSLRLRNDVYTLKFDFNSLNSNDENIILFFSIINENNLPLKDHKNFDDFKKLLKENKDYKKAISSLWISDLDSTNINWDEKSEYVSFRNLLIKKLDDFQKNNQKSSKIKKFPSFSIAYMARWGTGKTTIVRELAQDLEKFYNTVEINLWHISNSLSKENNVYNEDSFFVRSIIKEAITQLSNNRDLTINYIDSSRRLEEFKHQNDVKEEMLNSLLKVSINTKPETIFRERSKFLDQHISSLTRVTETIFNNTFKPTIFIFDDLDRIDDENNIVQLLDALVAFLNIPNSVYIIPMDEAKIMKAISNVKIGKDPYSFINKYFNFSIRAPFIPRLNTFTTIIEIVKKLKMNKIFVKNNKNLGKSQLLSKCASIFPLSYRSIKDYLNVYQNNIFILEKNKFVKDLTKSAQINNETINDSQLKELIMMATILQIQAPLLSDYLSHDINRKEDLFDIFSYKKPNYDLFNILELLKKWNLNIEELEQENQSYELKIKNSEFWSSLLNIEIPIKEYKNVEELVEKIIFSIKNNDNNDKNKEIIKNFIVEKIEKIIKIFKIFNLQGNKNSTYKLLFWTLFTLAEIDNPEAINFAKDVDLYSTLSILNQEKCKEEFEKIKNDFEKIDDKNQDFKEKLESFFDKLFSYKEKGFVNINEYNSIIKNFISKNIELNFTIDFTQDKFIKDVIDKLLNENKNGLIYDFFKKISKKTREKILEFLNKRKWKHEYDNQDEQKNKVIINIEQIKEIVESNNDIIINEFEFLNQKINLEEKFLFEFLLKNEKKFDFWNLIPLDIEKFKKNKKKFEKLLSFYFEINQKIDLKEVIKNLNLSFISNNKLQKYTFKNIDNFCYFILNNNDFKNIDKFSQAIIEKLFQEDYFIFENIKKLLKNSAKVFNKKIIDSSNELILMNHEKIIKNFIEAKSFLNKKSKTDIIFEHKNSFLNSNAKSILQEIILQEIELWNKNKDEEKLIEIVRIFDDKNDKLKLQCQVKLGFKKEFSFKNEPLLKSTPISEILNGNCFLENENKIKIKKLELIEKIDQSSENEINELFNLNNSSSIYVSLLTIFKFLNSEDKYRFYKLPNKDSTNFDLEKEKNSKNLIIHNINKTLSFQNLKSLSEKSMPKYRIYQIITQLEKFEFAIEKYKKFGHKYNLESFNKINQSNIKDEKNIKNSKPFLEKWFFGEIIEFPIFEFNKQKEIAKENEKEYKDKIKDITFINNVYKIFQMVDQIKNISDNSENKDFKYNQNFKNNLFKKHKNFVTKFNNINKLEIIKKIDIINKEEIDEKIIKVEYQLKLIDDNFSRIKNNLSLMLDKLKNKRQKLINSQKKRSKKNKRKKSKKNDLSKKIKYTN